MLYKVPHNNLYLVIERVENDKNGNSRIKVIAYTGDFVSGNDGKFLDNAPSIVEFIKDNLGGRIGDSGLSVVLQSKVEMFIQDFNKILNNYMTFKNQKLVDALKSLELDFQGKPVNSNTYYNMLEVLPPKAMSKGAFLVGEADYISSDGLPLYPCFLEEMDGGTKCYYYLGNMTLKNFKETF